MGSKTRRNGKSSQKCESRFPIGKFRKQRAALQADYLSKSKEICGLKKRLQRLNNKVILG